MEGCTQIPVSLMFPAFPDDYTARCKDSMAKLIFSASFHFLHLNALNMAIDICGQYIKGSLMQGQYIGNTCTGDKGR